MDAQLRKQPIELTNIEGSAKKFCIFAKVQEGKYYKCNWREISRAIAQRDIDY